VRAKADRQLKAVWPVKSSRNLRLSLKTVLYTCDKKYLQMKVAMVSPMSWRYLLVIIALGEQTVSTITRIISQKGLMSHCCDKETPPNSQRLDAICPQGEMKE